MRRELDVDASLESATDEAARLRRCLNDLISIMALPALWAGREPRQSVEPLVNGPAGMLRYAFVFVRLNDTDGGQPIEIVRIGAPLDGTIREHDISIAIDATLAGAAPRRPISRRVSVGNVDLSIASAYLG